MSRRRRRPALLAVLGLALAAGLGGCGFGGRPGSVPPTSAPPATTATRSTTPRPTPIPTTAAPSARALAIARRTHELPTPVGAQHVPGGWRTPTQAVTVFAATYIDWTAATVVVRLHELARASVGQARSAMSYEAGRLARDPTLLAGGISNAGAVEAVAPIRGRRDVYAVLTRERTSAREGSAYRGLAPAWHVALATVTRIDDGLWVVSDWQPES